jgi:hypothetical protein
MGRPSSIYMSVDCFKVAVGLLPQTYKLSQHNSFHVSRHGLMEQLPCVHSIIRYPLRYGSCSRGLWQAAQPNLLFEPTRQPWMGSLMAVFGAQCVCCGFMNRLEPSWVHIAPGLDLQDSPAAVLDTSAVLDPAWLCVLLTVGSCRYK